MKEMLMFLSSLRSSYYLYIGDGDLIALKHFIDGYLICLQNTGKLDDPNDYNDFCSFMEQHYQFDSSSISIYQKIQQHSSSIHEAFTTFFDLLDEFLKNS